MQYDFDKCKDFTPDDKNKIVFIWAPRSACSSMVQMAFDSIGILQTALDHHQFVHYYRINYFQKNVKDFEYYVNNKYYLLKLVRNPYYRLVSIYLLLLEDSIYNKTFYCM